MVMAIPLELSLACPTIHRVKDPSDPCSLDVSASNQSSAHPYIPYKLHGTQNPPKHVENKVQYQQRLAQGSDHSAKSCTLINKTCSGSHGKREPVGIQGAPLSLFLAHQCGPASAIGNARKRGSTVLERGADCSSFSESFDHDRTGDDGSSRGSEEEAQGRRLVVRKKLRLSKEESALLEEKFEEHSTLTPKQKNALAKQLNLQPRQVEVWFQNRRARTKLKQTEVDCELLRKCCASLTEENRRLQMEVDQLRALSTAQLHSLIRGGQHGPFPDAPLTICPQCQRISAGSAATSSSITTSNSCLHQAPARPNSLSSQPQPSSSQN